MTLDTGISLDRDNLTDRSTNSVCVSSKLHISQLQPCPIGVKLSRSNKSQMYSEASVNR